VRRILPLLFFLTIAATPAAATTCAPREVATDDLVAGGLESRSHDYDFAVVGRVAAVTTDMSEGENHGRTYVEISVSGAFGTRTGWSGVVVTTPDPGWVSGYAFEEGRSYFVPFVAEGPDGMINYVGACDLVEEVADADVTAAHLAEVASENGVDFVYPIATSASGAFVTVIFLGVLGFLLWWTVRMRRSSRTRLSGTGSDPLQPPEPRP
jgi:hypothetical protein